MTGHATAPSDHPFLANAKAMDVEHAAWQEALDRLAHRLGVERKEFNKPEWNDFVDQIRYWGETLVALRRRQEPDQCDRILAEAKALAENGR